MKSSQSHSNWLLIAIFLIATQQNATLAGPTDSSTDRDAVRRGTNSIWVERETDTVASSPNQLSRTDVADRHNSIRSNSQSQSLWQWLFGSRSQSGSSTLSDFFQSLLELWRILIFFFIAMVVAVAIYLVAKNNGFQGFLRRKRPQLNVEDIEQQRAKISDLPFELEQPLIGLRAQADRYRIAGDYSKATMYLFSYLLVELDHAHCLRLERGKTNGAYLRELRSQPDLHDYLSQTARLFERTYFGRHSIAGEAFDSLWNRLPRFEGALTQVRNAKSQAVVDVPPAVLTEARA